MNGLSRRSGCKGGSSGMFWKEPNEIWGGPNVVLGGAQPGGGGVPALLP